MKYLVLVIYLLSAPILLFATAILLYAIAEPTAMLANCSNEASGGCYFPLISSFLFLLVLTPLTVTLLFIFWWVKILVHTVNTTPAIPLAAGTTINFWRLNYFYNQSKNFCTLIVFTPLTIFLVQIFI
jgi:hypothetical protein